MSQSFTIVFPLYEGVTHLDFTGPHQFFSRVPAATVVVASMGATPVHADGLVFSELADLASIEACDLLCVPGGSGCSEALTVPGYLDSLRRLASTARRW